MNCVPGDIAYVTRELRIPTCSGPKPLVKVGTIVQVSYLISQSKKHWQLSDELACSVVCSCGTTVYSVGHLPDAVLKPIRPVPEDAEDETLSWVPVPKEKLPELV